MWKDSAMTKNELILRLAEKYSKLSHKDASVVVETIFDQMTEAMRQDERIEIRGFGSFSVLRRESRMGRNPKTGEQVKVPEKKVPFFKAGKELREKVDFKA
jgi:integration host factor subunit beta